MKIRIQKIIIIYLTIVYIMVNGAHKMPKTRSYSDIYKIITGNPYNLDFRNIYSKRPYPRQPFWPHVPKHI